MIDGTDVPLQGAANTATRVRLGLVEPGSGTTHTLTITERCGRRCARRQFGAPRPTEKALLSGPRALAFPGKVVMGTLRRSRRGRPSIFRANYLTTWRPTSSAMGISTFRSARRSAILTGSSTIAGRTRTNVVQTTVYVKDLARHFEAIERAHAAYLGAPANEHCPGGSRPRISRATGRDCRGSGATRAALVAPRAVSPARE